MSEDEDLPESIILPIDGCLDLHAFAPRDIRTLLPDYLALCRTRGLLTVRIVHGKGSGTLQRSVHALLGRLPDVISFSLAPPEAGGWGATLVQLRPPPATTGFPDDAT